MLISALFIAGCLKPANDPRLSLQLDFTVAGDPLSKVTVIFEHGAGVPFNDYAKLTYDEVFLSISEVTQVVRYNRAGIWKSQSSDRPRHAEDIVDELRTMLQELSIDPPYLLVGHSLGLGGLYMEYFARNYPDEVVGVLLLDPIVSDFVTGCYAVLGPDYAPLAEYLCDAESSASMLSMFEPMRAEMISASGISRQQIIDSPPLRDMPFEVQSATFYPIPPPLFQTTPWPDSMEPYVQWYQERHAEMAASAPNGRHVLIDDAAHLYVAEKPWVVTNAITDMLVEIQH